MHRTWNQHVVKQENKTLVLSTIINRTPISRAGVAQVTGLNKGTVSSLVSELISEDLVTESGPGKSSGGRRPVMLLFNEKAGYSISIELEIGHILGVISDLNGNIIVRENLQMKTTLFDTVFPSLVNLIKELIDRVPRSRYGVIGIGVAVPGVVTHEGKVLLAPNLDWKNVDLQVKLADYFDLPIYIENEADAGAYGEVTFGSSADTNHMIYVSLGVGIGIGLVLDGKLYQGASGFSGEMGHMTIIKDGLSCRCGNRGCWEKYASERALLNEGIKRQLITEDEPDPLDKLIRLAAENNQEAIDLFEEIATYIAIGLTNCINIFNPEFITLGNSLIKAKEWLFPVIKAHVEKHAIGFNQDQLQMETAQLGNDSTVLGMAAFIIEDFLLNYNTQKN